MHAIEHFMASRGFFLFLAGAIFGIYCAIAVTALALRKRRRARSLMVPGPIGSRRMWYSRKRGIHDSFTHHGWCLPADDCELFEPHG